jgi:hypothetical protein
MDVPSAIPPPPPNVKITAAPAPHLHRSFEVGSHIFFAQRERHASGAFPLGIVSNMLRILGLVFFALGLWIAYQYIYEPWTAMRAGATAIDISTRAVLSAPVMVVIGTLMLLLGNEAAQLIAEDGERRREGAVMFVVTLGIGIGLCDHLNNQARAGGMSETLSMPVAIDFRDDHFKARDARGREASVNWASLERVQLELRSADGEVFDKMYWQFTLPQGIQVHIPVAAHEPRMLEEIGKHLDRVDPQPLEFARGLIRKGEARSPLKRDVWVR